MPVLKGKKRRIGSGAPQIRFVTVSHPQELREPRVQSEIHHHAMRHHGHQRRNKPRAVVIPLEFVPLLENESAPQPYGMSLCRPLHPPGLASLEYDARSLQLMHFACNDSKSFYRPFRALYMRLAFFDNVSRNLVLANAVLFLRSLQQSSDTPFESTIESVSYYCKSLSELSDRLGDPTEYLTEGVFSAVIAFLCHDINIGNWRRWETHMAGLKKLAELRGGLEGLGNQIPLLAFWLDLMGSVVLEQKPTFGLPHDAGSDTTAPSCAVRGLPALSCIQPDSSTNLEYITGAMSLMMGVAKVVNTHGMEAQFWKGEAYGITLLGPVIFRVLSMPQHIRDMEMGLIGYHLSIFFELLRLTLLVILAQLKVRFSYHASEIKPLQKKLTDLASKSNVEWGHISPDFELWALLTNALISTGYHRSAFVRSAKQVMDLAGVKNAEEAIELARSILWFELLENDHIEAVKTELDRSA